MRPDSCRLLMGFLKQFSWCSLLVLIVRNWAVNKGGLSFEAFKAGLISYTFILSYYIVKFFIIFLHSGENSPDVVISNSLFGSDGIMMLKNYHVIMEVFCVYTLIKTFFGNKLVFRVIVEEAFLTHCFRLLLMRINRSSQFSL